MTDSIVYTAQQRDGLITSLRRSLGDAADSPTLGYYRDLPDPVLAEVTDHSTRLSARMLRSGLLSYGFMIVAAGSMAADAKQLAAGFGVAAIGLAIDAARAHKKQDRIKDRIFGLTD